MSLPSFVSDPLSPGHERFVSILAGTLALEPDDACRLAARSLVLYTFAPVQRNALLSRLRSHHSVGLSRPTGSAGWPSLAQLGLDQSVAQLSGLMRGVLNYLAMDGVNAEAVLRTAERARHQVRDELAQHRRSLHDAAIRSQLRAARDALDAVAADLAQLEAVSRAVDGPDTQRLRNQLADTRTILAGLERRPAEPEPLSLDQLRGLATKALDVTMLIQAARTDQREVLMEDDSLGRIQSEAASVFETARYGDEPDAKHNGPDADQGGSELPARVAALQTSLAAARAQVGEALERAYDSRHAHYQAWRDAQLRPMLQPSRFASLLLLLSHFPPRPWTGSRPFLGFARVDSPRAAVERLMQATSHPTQPEIDPGRWKHVIEQTVRLYLPEMYF
jgi:hypothetical protein